MYFSLNISILDFFAQIFTLLDFPRDAKMYIYRKDQYVKGIELFGLSETRIECLEDEIDVIDKLKAKQNNFIVHFVGYHYTDREFFIVMA